MSYDRQIDQVCPHMVVDETLFMAEDRIMVRPLKPIASTGSVRVRIDGAIDVPSQGSLLPARAMGSKEGPLTIRTGVNDSLTVQINGEAFQTVALPAATRMDANYLADMLSARLQGIVFASVGNRMTLHSTSEGRRATIQFQSPSPLAEAMGFET